MNAIDDMKKKFADRDGNLFDDWWHRTGQHIDPRKALAKMAYDAAMSVSRNYVADDAVDPLQFTFANGRIVQWSETGLRVGVTHSEPHYTEETCPGHIASDNDPKVCGRCGVHINSFRPDDEAP